MAVELVHLRDSHLLDTAAKLLNNMDGYTEVYSDDFEQLLMHYKP